jgi:hypothetical protein
MIRGKGIAFAKNILSSFESQRVVCSNEEHVRLAMEWLCRAHAKTRGNGVSEGYHLYHGWLPAYPETTGYIIETFCAYAERTSDYHYRDAAIAMADWLVSIQDADGALPDSYFKKKMVFDTGQVVFGLVEAFKKTELNKFKQAAIKAADWVIAQQEVDGSWKRHAAHEIPHSYYSRVAWSLLKVHEITSADRYSESCRHNIEWCLGQQLSNGWFQKAAFTRNNQYRPFTHTIAYTIRGILEAGIYLKESRYISAAKLALDNIALQIKDSGFIAGTFDQGWKGDRRYSCLTGNAQLSISYLTLAKLLGSMDYYQRARTINKYVKSKQNCSTGNLDIRGAIAGSSPIWGDYIHFTYPNWAAKFFVDALLLENNVAQQHGWL